MRVGLFVTCLTDTFFPRVGVAVVKTLRHLGCEVEFPRAQTCCGQPGYTAGLLDESAALLERTASIFAPYEHVVSPSGSCVAMVRLHGAGLFDDPARRRAVEELAAKTHEFTSFLSEVLEVDWTELVRGGAADLLSHGRPADGLARGGTAGGEEDSAAAIDDETEGETDRRRSCTYHYPCHLRGLVPAPRAHEDAARLPGFVPAESFDLCCGFGGSFATKLPRVSDAMLEHKLQAIEATGAGTLVCNEGGCGMQLGGGLRRRGSGVRVRHVAELIAEAHGWELPGEDV